MSCVRVQGGREVLNPFFFSGGLTLWWDADRPDSGGNFIDLSRNSKLGTNANVTFVPGVINGRPVARYNGVNSATTINSFSLGFDFSAFIVSKLAAAGGVYVGFCNATATNQVLVSNAGENLGCFDNVNHPTSNLFDNHTAFSAVGVICTAGSCVFYQNGVNIGAPGAVIGAVGGFVNFGAVIGVFSAFDIAEVVVYGAPITANQLALLTQYFRGKYNL